MGQCFFPSSPQQWNEECTGPYSNTKPREWAYPGRAVTPASFPRSKKISIWNTVHICTIFSSCVLIYCYLVIFFRNWAPRIKHDCTRDGVGLSWAVPKVRPSQQPSTCTVPVPQAEATPQPWPTVWPPPLPRWKGHKYAHSTFYMKEEEFIMSWLEKDTRWMQRTSGRSSPCFHHHRVSCQFNTFYKA